MSFREHPMDDTEQMKIYEQKKAQAAEQHNAQLDAHARFHFRNAQAQAQAKYFSPIIAPMPAVPTAHMTSEEDYSSQSRKHHLIVKPQGTNNMASLTMEVDPETNVLAANNNPAEIAELEISRSDGATRVVFRGRAGVGVSVVLSDEHMKALIKGFLILTLAGAEEKEARDSQPDD